MGFSDAQMEGRRERDGGMAGCTYTYCQEKKWTFVFESASLFHSSGDETHSAPVGKFHNYK